MQKCAKCFHPKIQNRTKKRAQETKIKSESAEYCDQNINSQNTVSCTDDKEKCAQTDNNAVKKIKNMDGKLGFYPDCPQ